MVEPRNFRVSITHNEANYTQSLTRRRRKVFRDERVKILGKKNGERLGWIDRQGCTIISITELEKRPISPTSDDRNRKISARDDINRRCQRRGKKENDDEKFPKGRRRSKSLLSEADFARNLPRTRTLVLRSSSDRKWGDSSSLRKKFGSEARIAPSRLSVEQAISSLLSLGNNGHDEEEEEEEHFLHCESYKWLRNLRAQLRESYARKRKEERERELDGREKCTTEWETGPFKLLDDVPDVPTVLLGRKKVWVYRGSFHV